ncbi:MAG: TonB-dependent receptor [Bacteroidetes bacterium]|nr:TonB-dependent receptor [Bacteroidota bacterium]MBL7103964.1 TonB-dependent receptor [Bacteroidales bacterium]
MTGIAQTGEVTGTVTDASDGQTLPGVTILIKGTTIGTTTDVDGNYKIMVEPDATLVFSYIGYETQEIVVQPNTVVNVALNVAVAELEEFVVIGYGVVKKKDATGAVTAIESKSFNRGVLSSPAALIAGKVAGVQVSSNSGAPGESNTIRIRGGSSLNASNDPLYVIDGVPISNATPSGTLNPLNSINPNDIESFTVLKDASATAIYGSRASNGVILITTKKGKEGGKFPLRLNYTGKFSYQEVPKKIGVLSSNEFESLLRERYPERVDMMGTWTDSLGNPVVWQNLPDPEDREGYEQTIHNTNWQDEIYNNAFAMDHSLSIYGAYKMLPYRVSLGYTDQDGILKTSNFKRTTVGLSLNPTLLDDHLKINLNVTGAFIKNTFANRGAIGAATQMDPTKPVNSLDGSYGGYWAWLDANEIPLTQPTSNPMSQLNLTDDKSDANRSYGNLQLDYKLHFLPELRANLNVGYDFSKNSGTRYVPPYAAWSFNSTDGGGEDNNYNNRYENKLLDFYLNYVKDVESIKSRFDVMAGYSWQHFFNSSNSYNSNIPTFIDPITGDSTGQQYIRDTIVDKGEYYLISFFGRFNYTFNDKYLLTFTLRNDGTSRFHKDNRWGLFPALALGWKINEEVFLKDSKAVSQLKLRLGWGITGQQDIGGYYDYMGRYTYGNPFAMYPFGNTYYITLRPEGYNPDLKWEETTTWNIGIDFGFLEDRIYGSLDFYKRLTKDLLSWVPVPAGSNLSNYINRNIGELKNEGIEFSIGAKAIVKENMLWDIGFNITYNKNEITELYQGASIATGGIAGGVGNNIQEQAVGQAVQTFYVYEQVYDQDGNPIEGLYVDRNGDGEITTSDKYYFKKPAPDFYFGITSNLTWKDWNLFLSGRANFGNYAYNNVQAENGWLNRMYRSEGPYISNITSARSETNFETARYFSDYWIQNASFFRMDDITLSYTFKQLVNDRMDIRLSATVNNAFVITQYKGLDPEVQNGIDGNIFPRSRIWMFGVNLVF